MKSKILLLAVSVALLSSCSTSYKNGQTPDDVYYSPVRPENHNEYAKKEKKEEKKEEPKYRNNDDYVSYEDQYLRMKVRDRYRWNELDDPYYYSRRYNAVSYNCCCFSNPWTPNSYWNNHFNPYYQSNIIVNPKSSVAYTAPRTFNLNSYNNNALTNSNYTNPKINNSNSGSNNNSYNNTYNAPRNSNTRRDDNSGNILRDIFKGSNNNNSSGNSNNNSSPSNTSGNSSSGSSSGSSTSTPAPVRKF